jgi:glycosyltransferase involved in cell wall biosynthesis
MACGRPVIACGSGGAPEAVIDQSTGLLVPPGDHEALAEAVSTLTEDVSLREALGSQAKAWIEEQFTIERYSSRIEHLYQELMR